MNLFVVSYTFEQGRRFCQSQGINFRKAELVSTDAAHLLPIGYLIGDEDALIRYGPWMEGRNVYRVMKTIEQQIVGQPFEYDVYESSERIPWPEHILINLGVSNERR